MDGAQQVAVKVDIKSQQDFDRWVVRESKERPVVVDFWAPWCAPCRTLTPILEALVQEDKGNWLLVKINTDQHPQLAQRFGIRGIPAVKAFRHGKVIDEFVGVLPPEQLRMWLDFFVPSEADELAAAAKQYEDKQDWASARSHYEQALEIKPLHNPSLLGLARVAYAEGNDQEALRLLNNIHTDDEQMAQAVAQLRLALQSSDAGDIDTLRRQVEADEDDHQARYQLGLALSTQGQYEAALETLLEVIKRCRSDNPELTNQARQGMVELFDVIGFQHPLSQQFRARLATELYQ